MTSDLKANFSSRFISLLIRGSSMERESCGRFSFFSFFLGCGWVQSGRLHFKVIQMFQTHFVLFFEKEICLRKNKKKVFQHQWPHMIVLAFDAQQQQQQTWHSINIESKFAQKYRYSNPKNSKQCTCYSKVTICYHNQRPLLTGCQIPQMQVK
jgi:hypothetical protein